jgi:hypothetical protein
MYILVILHVKLHYYHLEMVKAHIKLPVVIYALRNLVTKNRAPISVQDGIMYFRFL